jgi:YidC/Oxa1 family membrane protein insertase
VDKKNTLFGALLFIAAFLVLVFGQRFRSQNPAPSDIRREVSKQVATEGPNAAVPAGSNPSATPASLADQPTFATAQADQTGSTVTRIGNSFVEVSFTTAGGSIRDVAFKKYPAVRNQPEPFIFNELHANPMLAFVGYPGLDSATRYALVSASDREVVYRTVLENRVEVTRRYTISPDKATETDPYLIRCETTLRNLTDKGLAPMRVAFSIGTAAPSNALDNGLQLTTEFSNGKDQVLVRRSELEASGGFLGYGAHGPKAAIPGEGPVAWATVKNQFFAAILTPDDPAAALETRRVKLLDELPDTDRKAYGITGDVDFQVAGLPAHGETSLGASFYVGPKEYPRLSNQDVFKKDQDRIMDLGSFVFRFCGGLLLTAMAWVHRWTSNWGVAIILTTLGLKVLLLPLTITQARSSRRMQKIMPEMKLVREKFKDNPQKQQTAMMELYKQHKVNPLGGCLPMLFTLPFFYAFFRMLQSASELRFAPFLWVRDLSAQDTVARIALPIVGTIPLNIMPIIVVATIAIQMRLTPQPTVDNAQMKMMKFMPFFMLLIYYNYSCALSLYSTVNGLCIIAQQLIVNRSVDSAPVAALAPGRPGKPTKNVTPRKR